jgi:hypothetical protein
MYIRRFLKSVGHGALWILVCYIIWGIDERRHLLHAFDVTVKGETLKVVLDRFGPPSRLEPRYDVRGYDAGSRSICGESCWIRLWYEVPFNLGISPVSVDFDAHEVVIDKYQWNSP